MGTENKQLTSNESTSTGLTSAAEELNNNEGYAIHAKWTVNSKSNKTFVSGRAFVAIQDLTYVADAVGTGGNAITIEYTAGGTAGSEVVTVVGNAISVQIESASSTATQVKTAIDNDVGAALLVEVIITGTAGTGQTAPVAATNLANGAAATINLTSNQITIATHGYLTGLKVALSTAGAVPGGTSATNYYVIKVDANTIKLATSQALALAESGVDITSYGYGTQTLTPASIAGTITREVSVNGADFVSMADAIAISATGEKLWEEDIANYTSVRVVSTITAGEVTQDTYFSGKTR